MKKITCRSLENFGNREFILIQYHIYLWMPPKSVYCMDEDQQIEDQPLNLVNYRLIFFPRYKMKRKKKSKSQFYVFMHFCNWYFSKSTSYLMYITQKKKWFTDFHININFTRHINKTPFLQEYASRKKKSNYVPVDHDYSSFHINLISKIDEPSFDKWHYVFR